MARKFIDCRDHPSDVKCTVALSADTEEELMEAVVQHGKTVHGYEDTPEFRDTGTSDLRLVKKPGPRAKTRIPGFAARSCCFLRGDLKRPSATSSRHARARLFQGLRES
jgi:predicted small metal-binding protein